MEAGPLIGRERELELGRRALLQGPGVVIFGAAGIGKSRLARELARDAENRGIVTRRVLATASASEIPFAALGSTFPLAVASAGHDWRAVVRQAQDALAKMGEGTRPLLVVDDADLLDGSSRVLLLQLVDAASVSLVLSIRTGRIVPDEIQQLWRDEGLFRLDLGGLTDADSDLLARVLVGGRLDEASLRGLAQVCEGNPLFISEVISTARSAGDLVEGEGVWRLSSERVGTSKVLADYVRMRLDGLDPAAVEALEIVAVGVSVGVDDLLRLSSEEAVDTLERAALLVVDVDGRRRSVRVAHSLYGEVVVEGLTHTRRRRILRALVDMIDDHGGRRIDDAVRLSLWSLEIGRVPDVATLMEAARFAGHTALDYALAARLAEEALHVGGGFEAAAMLGAMRFELGEFEAANEALTTAASAATSPPERTLAGLRRMGTAVWGLGNPEMMDDVLAELGEDQCPGEWRAQLELRGALMLSNLGRPLEALRIVNAHGASVVPLTRCWAEERLARGLAYAVTCSAEDAIEVAIEGFAGQYDMTPDPMLPNAATHLLCQVIALGECGRLAEAIAIAEFCYRESALRRVPWGQVYFLLAMARDHGRQGDLDASSIRFQEAASVSNHYGHRVLHAHALAGLAEVRALQGMIDESQELLGRADEVGLGLPLFAADRERARACNQWARGSIEDACVTLRAAAAAARTSGFLYFESAILHDQVRMGYPAEVVGRLEGIAARAQGPVPALRFAHARALDRGDPEGLEAVACRWQALGFELLAAETFAQAADDFRKQRMASRQNRALVRLAELHERNSTWHSPALARVRDHAPPLSRREREVALLAIDGHTNREIGERLHIAKRTVDTHLQNIFRKLGSNSRAGLAEALGRDS